MVFPGLDTICRMIGLVENGLFFKMVFWVPDMTTILGSTDYIWPPKIMIPLFNIRKLCGFGLPCSSSFSRCSQIVCNYFGSKVRAVEVCHLYEWQGRSTVNCLLTGYWLPICCLVTADSLNCSLTAYWSCLAGFSGVGDDREGGKEES